MDIDFVVPSIEGDRIIPLYTNSLTLQRQSPKWHFCRFWQILIKELYMQKHNSQLIQ